MTKIAISAETTAGLDAPVCAHFGHAPCFAVVELEGAETRSVETVANPYLSGHEPGQIPAFIHSLGAQVMLSGGMGGRAVAFFQQYGITVSTGATGTVRETLARYLNGELDGAAPCAESVEHGHG